MKHFVGKLLMICISLEAAISAPLAVAASSGSFDDDGVIEAKPPCSTCGSIRPTVKPIIVPKPAVEAPRPPAPIPQVRVSFNNPGGKEINLSCRSFMDGYGNYGEHGRMISSLMTNNFANKYYTNKNSLKAFCPNFDKFESNELKIKAWTWFWMVLANEESDCTVKYAHATHTRSGVRINPRPGYGMFAAELSSSLRDARPMCSGDIKTAKVQIMCAVGTMVDTQLSKGLGVYREDGYWGPARRYKKQILPNMRGFKPCFSR